MLLAVCLMIAALPLSVSAAGEYVPGNPRWSGYQNQVQWGRPAGAASGDSFEYEAQLLLGDDVVESKAVEIDTYLFFTNDVVTRPQEEYTIRVRARWIMIVGDPDGQYMVADVGEAEHGQTARPFDLLLPELSGSDRDRAIASGKKEL